MTTLTSTELVNLLLKLHEEMLENKTYRETEQLMHYLIQKQYGQVASTMTTTEFYDWFRATETNETVITELASPYGALDDEFYDAINAVTIED